MGGTRAAALLLVCIAAAAAGCRAAPESADPAAVRLATLDDAARVDALLDAGDARQATEIARGMLDRDPASVTANVAAARAFGAAAVLDQDPRAYDEAIGRATFAAQADPRDPAPLFARGRLEFDRRHYTAAAGDFAAVIALDARHAGALRMAAWTERALRRPKAERKAWERLLAAHPDDADAHARLGRVLLEADDAAVSAAPAGGKYGDTRESRADRRRLAREQFERAAALDPQHATALQELAALAADDGDLGAAEQFLRRATAAAEAAGDAFRATDAWFNLGAVLQSQGDRAAARAAYERSIALAPPGPAGEPTADPRPLANLGALLVQSGSAPEDVAEGRRFLRAALDAGVKGSAARDIRALLDSTRDE